MGRLSWFDSKLLSRVGGGSVHVSRRNMSAVDWKKKKNQRRRKCRDYGGSPLRNFIKTFKERFLCCCCCRFFTSHLDPVAEKTAAFVLDYNGSRIPGFARWHFRFGDVGGRAIYLIYLPSRRLLLRVEELHFSAGARQLIFLLFFLFVCVVTFGSILSRHKLNWMCQFHCDCVSLYATTRKPVKRRRDRPTFL